MGLRQQIIAERVEALAKKGNFTYEEAFTRFTHSLILGKGTASFNSEDIVDGGQDKQVDVITIEENEKDAVVYISQVTTSESFSSTKLVSLGNGLRWIFHSSDKELARLSNQAFVDKIRQFRTLRLEKGPSNIQVHVRFIANGTTKIIWDSDEFAHELSRIKDQYDDDTFDSFSIQAIGYDELTDLLNVWEKQSKKVNADLKILYDKNNASYIRHDSKGLKGVVCSVPANEIANLVNSNKDGSIFDLNIRQYLGSRGKVNKDILETCASDESHKFWFLNNGITIICSNFDVVPDADNPHVKLKNLQIVNGCQTATSIAAAQKEGMLKLDTSVITRVYETQDNDLISRIVLTTNSQNQITTRNLWANDPLQVDMEKAFKINGYYYERKPRQFENVPSAPLEKIFNNEFVAQSYMAIFLQAPSEARARRYRVWGDMRNRVFSGKDKIEKYIYAALLNERVGEWLRASSYYSTKNTAERTLARRGQFHIARISSHMLVGGGTPNSLQKIRQQIKLLQKIDPKLNKIYEKAFRLLLATMQKSDYKDDMERGLKAPIIDKEIDKVLYKKGGKKK